MLNVEGNYVSRTFRENFKDNNHPLVLYGIGENTKIILEVCEDLNIIGLMDSETVGQVKFGKKVLSYGEVIALKPSVVIIARNSLVSIIYKRIVFLEKNGIEIYKVDGTKLEEHQFIYSNENLVYWNSSKEQLKKRIEEHEIVSFDIFDTLITRQVLKPSDIFHITAIEFQKKCNDEKAVSWVHENFYNVRIAVAEKIGVKSNIQTYYKLIAEQYGVAEVVCKQLMELEYDIEKRFVRPRSVMVELLRYALKLCKKVYLISDMYFDNEKLMELLQTCDIFGNFELIISCDVNACKEDGTLFALFLAKVNQLYGEELSVNGRIGERCLHIGDNRIADISMPSRYGIDTYLVMSGFELLMASSMQSVLVDVGTLWWRRTVGSFICTYFNDPFVLHGKAGFICIENLYDLGYFFIAPLIYEYVLWLRDEICQDEIEQMLFPSRDGYLLYLVYEKMRKKLTTLPVSIYFKASRRAVTVASIQTLEDMKSLAKRKFNGTVRDFFAARMGVLVDDITMWENISDTTESLHEVFLLERYEKLVRMNAVWERKNYLGYLSEKGILNKGKHGFFDFVAGGTVQYHLEKMLGEEMSGYYFATMNLPNEFYGIGKIKAPFGNITSYGESGELSKHYLLLESILTDQDSTLVNINEEGKCVFVEKRNDKYQSMERIHNGVLQYVDERMKLNDDLVEECDFKASEILFGCLFNEECIVSERLKNCFVNDDTYDGISEYENF